MPFTADQYSQIAEGYENAAADPLVAGEKRVDLVKKAEWFRFLAQRERAHENERGFTALTRPEAEPPSQGRSWRSMTPFLTTLWITGAAVYLLSTVLFTNAVNLFGPEEPKTPVPEIRRSVESVPKAANVEADNMAEQANGQSGATPERRHAISPDQPTYESPTLTAALPPLPREEPTSQDFAQESPTQNAVLPSPSQGEGATSAPLEPSEMLTVTSAATIRNGPSTAAKKIGTATAGAELQVKGREKDWVHFVDPSSGNTGWIQSSLLAPAAGAAGIALPEPTKPTPVRPAKPKIAKKKPSAPAEVSPRPRAYADLPVDEEFLPPRRRGPGLLSRRRMLRDGLMSPGFLPPD